MNKTNKLSKKGQIKVLGENINYQRVKKEDFFSLTDIARFKDSKRSDYVIQNWLRNRNTLDLLGLWEGLYNQNFNSIEFDGFKEQSGLNSFVLTPKQWIFRTNAVGIISKQGRFGGTYAHKDIALEFASWISVKFKLFLIKEFQRLKEKEQKLIGWDARREFAKINYEIQTDAIKHNLIPKKITLSQKNKVYSSEADILNIAVFGMSANEWKINNKNKKGNIRDFASISQLLCLANLESLNSELIKQKKDQVERLIRLNAVAISQMKILTKSLNVKKLEKQNFLGGKK